MNLNKEKVLRILGLRSSNAATPIPNSKKYSRRIRYQLKKEARNGLGD